MTATARHAVPALISISLHGALLLAVGWVSIHRPAAVRELVRVTLIAGDGGEGTRAATSTVAQPSEPFGPPLPPAPVVPAKPVVPPVKPRVTKTAPNPRAVRAAAPPRPVAAEAAAPAPAGLTASSNADTAGLDGHSQVGGRMGNGSGSGGATGGRGDEDELRRYLALIRQRIERAKRYPVRARRARVEGSAEVTFEVDAHGQPRAMQLASASHPLLGDAALQAIAAAAPFPPKPAGNGPLRIEVPLRFNLTKE